MNKYKTKTLLIRLDKIGDLVLSLGVDQHPGLSDREVHWVVPKGLDFVMEAAVPSRSYTCWDKNYSKENFREFVSFLKTNRFDEVVFFQGAKWVMRALKKAGIPVRVGQRSNLLSMMYLNHGVKQKRSLGLKSEFEYNQELLEKGLKLEPKERLAPSVLKATSQKPEALLFEEESYVVIHAGMGGSALNWSQESYISLIEKLIHKKQSLVLTGTPGDMPYLDRIISYTETLPSHLVLNLVGKINGGELLFVLENAISVFAPSTGVAHLAASLGVKTRVIYPPITVQSATRWGSYGKQAKNISPQVDCPERFRCRGDACQFYPCMENIKTDDILGDLVNDSY